MAEVKTQPAGIPTTNTLNGIPDDLLGPVAAVIRLSGKNLLTMDTPPEMGEFVKMEITMRCKDDGRTLLADGGIGHYRVMSFIGAKVTAEPYKPEPEPEAAPEPGLFDQAGGSGDEDDDEDGDD